MTATTQTVTVPDGAVLHLEIHGTPSLAQPSLLFLHYYGGSPSTYALTLRQSKLDGMHSILYHARGWAPSTGPDDPAAYSIRAMSGDLAQIVRETGADAHGAGFILVGHSMGAKVAQHYAATAQPSRLKGLLLLAPAPLRGLRFPDEVKAQQRAGYEGPASVEYVLDHVLTAGPGALPAQARRQCIVDSLRGNDHARAAWPGYGAEEECGVECKDIEVPVLVLRGDRDFEREVVGELGVKEGWRNEVLEGCGHLVPLERPDVVARELKRFVDTL